jgi:hypothetical protein
MPLLRASIAMAVLAAALVLPGAAHAEKERIVVPPNNSAATQYTETFPTSGGNTEVNGSIDGGSSKGGSGGGSLDQEAKRALAKQGADGQAVERLISESAAAGSGGEGGSGSGHGSNGRGSGGEEPSDDSDGAGAPAAHGATLDRPSGSSGLGEVVSRGTLSSSGGMGVFLPLVLLAGLAWAAIFAWRRRHRETPPPGPAV